MYPTVAMGTRLRRRGELPRTLTSEAEAVKGRIKHVYERSYGGGLSMYPSVAMGTRL